MLTNILNINIVMTIFMITSFVITQRSRKYKSSPIRRALYYRPPPTAPLCVRPHDVAQDANTRKNKSSPIRRALYYRPPPAPTRARSRDTLWEARIHESLAHTDVCNTPTETRAYSTRI